MISNKSSTEYNNDNNTLTKTTTTTDLQTLDFYSDELTSLLRQSLFPNSDNTAATTIDDRTKPTTKNDGNSIIAQSDTDDIDTTQTAVDSSESDDEHGVTTGESDGEEPSSSPATIPEDDDNDNDPTTDTTRPQKNTPKKHSKTKTNKKPSQNQTKQMLPPPTTTLLLSPTTALRIPTSLLPLPPTTPTDPYHSFHSPTPSPPPPSPLHALYSLATDPHRPNVLVLLLRSGRLALALFRGGKCLKHATATRYTTRRGQGGAQSANDGGNGCGGSVGSRLRREGEVKLRNDLVEVLRRWRVEEEGVKKKGEGEGGLLLGGCGVFWLAVSKPLLSGFWEDVEKGLGSGGGGGRVGMEEVGLVKGGERVRSVPMDVGRPCYEACRAVYGWMMRCTLVSIDLSPVGEEGKKGEGKKAGDSHKSETNSEEKEKEKEKEKKKKTPEIIPLTPLHEAALRGDLSTILALVPTNITTTATQNGSTPPLHNLHQDINTRAGPKWMTPLHYAASSSTPPPTTTNPPTNPPPTPTPPPTTAASCISALLLHHHANPTILDLHHRPPYYLASCDTTRTAFRTARARLGEDTPYEWGEEGARVPPPLTEEDVERKREREKEKRRRKKKSQRERRKGEREREGREREEEERERRRLEGGVRVGGGGRKEGGGIGVGGGAECDFCKTKVKKRSKMFTRLEYVYCKSECVQKHKRELMANAAMARFGG